jgi:branched-chain amino acid transport system ATP-binding protein
VALLGTNGNGKSTLMKCVMGIVRPTRGSVSLSIEHRQHDLTKLSTEQIVNLGVAMVPEGRRLFPKLTVEENMLLGAFRPQARDGIRRNLAFSYEVFPILADRRRQLAGSLSGGQQQMLAIGRALMSAPKLLLIDEPSVGLAPILVSNTITKIKELKERTGLTVLLHHRARRDRVRGRRARAGAERAGEELLPRRRGLSVRRKIGVRPQPTRFANRGQTPIFR